MKVITTEKVIVLNSNEKTTLATETIKIRLHEEGDNFISIECVNLEPDDDFPEGCVTIGNVKELDEVFDVIRCFMVENC